MMEKKFEITNKLGLHARPATLFVQRVQKYLAEIKVRKDGQEEVADGKSVIDLLTLGAQQGSKVTIIIDGEDEEEIMKEIEELFSNKFYEG